MMKLPCAILASMLAMACRSQSGPEIGRPADWPTPDSAARACLEHPEARDYLKRASDRVLEKWRLPEGTKADHRVVLGFVLDAQGRPVRVAVFEASNRDIAQSALRAFEDAAPFPIPAGAECIAGVPIAGTFRNPALP
jgi:hypothetical protein